MDSKYSSISVTNSRAQRAGNFAADMQLPLLNVTNVAVYPYVMTSIMVDDPMLIEMVKKVMLEDRIVAVIPEYPQEPMPVTPELKEISLPTMDFGDGKLVTAGTSARITKMLTCHDGSLRLLVRGLRRISLKSVKEDPRGFYSAVYSPVMQVEEDATEIQATTKLIMEKFHELSPFITGMSEEVRLAVLNLVEPARKIDLLADGLSLSAYEKIAILAEPLLLKRAKLMLALVNREAEVAQLGARIQNEVNQTLSQQQREYFLREQLKTIQSELKEDSRTPDVMELEKRLKELDAPEEVKKTVEKEMGRLEMLPHMSPEYHIAYNYMDWLLSLPWRVVSETKLDIVEAEKVLNEDHYGLKDVKERILDYLAVLQMRKEDGKAPILCLVGPPGVGKTSLGRSIARAMGRKFIRVALGGVHDEAEIRGHRRTYVGALPGRIIQHMRKVGVANPVFMLDEIDKISSDHRGDPASALLEVLDPEQNSAFNDHYVELDYDLSKVFFIATANVLDPIPDPLLDRMEIIRLPGYTGAEKRQIARQYLVPRQVEENGLTPNQLAFNLSGIDELINHYTREAGVRHLERTIASVCRKVARNIVSGKTPADAKTTVKPELVHELLGGRKFLQEEAKNRPTVGSATGMAWTSYGGVILTVETTKMPGKGNLKLTGSLGNVMKESAEAAFSYIRSHADDFGVAKEVFETNDFHIHVPDGATPKDGPSAGITLTSALVSLLTGKRTLPRLSMTGEITLSGKVTAIGGLKEKCVAALRSGVKTVVMPKDNEKDLEDIPDEVKPHLNFVMVESIQEALPVIFGTEVLKKGKGAVHAETAS